MLSNRVVITGVGVVSGYGLTTEDFWDGLLSSKSAIKEYRNNDIKMNCAAVVPPYDESVLFENHESNLLDRFSQLAILAARQAVKYSGLEAESLREASTIIGSGAGGKHVDEDSYNRLYNLGNKRVHPLVIPKGMLSAASSLVSKDIGSYGPTFSVASACASGAHSIITGVSYVRQAISDVAIVGATDAPFPYGLLKAWDSLRVVSNDKCRPFCKTRSGMVLGEGAGILVIESLEHALKRGADIVAEIIGFGMTSDGGHITRPSKIGVANSMKSALKSSGISPNSLDYINAHGTGTAINDSIESQSIKEVFGLASKNILVSSTKPFHGHALGASSAMELIATSLTIRDGIIPSLINHSEIDENCDLNFVLDKALECPVEYAMSNSFAFGGLNASIILKKL